MIRSVADSESWIDPQVAIQIDARAYEVQL
jgi:hypothetical protein